VTNENCASSYLFFTASILLALAVSLLFVSGWRNIVAISAGEWRTIGLRYDCAIVTTDWRDPTLDWGDIVAISAGSQHMIALGSNGTIMCVLFCCIIK